jgi:hypothetical protein
MIIPENESLQPKDSGVAVISTANYINRFNVEDPEVIEALQAHPALCFLLGKVSEPQTVIDKSTGEKRNVRLLQEGSGMFALKDKEDAMRWQGIFNHIIGSSRHTKFIIDTLNGATPEQHAQLETMGYDFTSFNRYGKQNISEFMFVSHAGRRAMDEHNLYEIRDSAHLTGDSYQNTRLLLNVENAPTKLLELLEVENHASLMLDEGKTGRFLNIAVALLTYADWTFGQNPTTLSDRFKSLRNTQRAPKEELDVFETCATAFEKDMNLVLGKDLFAEMSAQKSKAWEAQVRSAYCSPSGLSPQEVFLSK